MLSHVTMIYNVCKDSINIILYILYHLDKEFDLFGDVTNPVEALLFRRGRKRHEHLRQEDWPHTYQNMGSSMIQ